MEPITVSIIGSIVLIVIAMIGYRWNRKKHMPRLVGPAPLNYVDIMKERKEKRERMKREARDWDEKKIADVLHYVGFVATSDHNAKDEIEALKSCEERLYPPLLQILENKRLYGKLTTATVGVFGPQPPIARLVEMIGANPPVTIIDALIPFLDDSKQPVRVAAAGAIAGTGLPEAIPTIKRCLDREDAVVEAHAVTRLIYFLEQSGAHDLYRDSLYDVFLAKWRACGGEYQYLKVMGLLYRERTKEIILQKDSLQFTSPLLESTLWYALTERISIPREELLRLIQEAETNGRYDGRLAKCIELLGLVAEVEDLELLETYLNASDLSLAHAAVDALLFYHGLKDVQDKLYTKYYESGFKGMNHHEVSYLSIILLDNSFQNGGVDGYLGSDCGDDWSLALDACKEMEMNRKHECLLSIGKEFGPEGPGKTLALRETQLASMGNNDEDFFHDLYTKYLATEDVYLFSSRYMIKHKEHFLHHDQASSSNN